MIFTYSNILMIFGIKEKIYNFWPYNVLLAIAANIPVLFVVQGHIHGIFFVSKDQGMSKVMLFNFNNAILYNSYTFERLFSTLHIK